MTNQNSENKKQIKCPQCGRLIFYDIQSPFRPFCSERCRLIDLGAWAEEKFKVPLEESEVLEEYLLNQNDHDTDESSSK